MCAIKIQLRRDTAANWAEQNPTLAQGEVGWEIGTDKYKIGDGVTAWNSLRYIQFGEIPNNGKLTIQKNGTTIAEFTANQSGNTTANIVADTPEWGNISGDIEDQTDLQTELGKKVNKNTDITGATHTKITYDSKGLVTGGTNITLADVTDITATATEVNYCDGVTSNIQTQLNGKLTTNDIENVLTSSATDKALSANQGKELNTRLNNVESRGRFLSIWIPATGLPQTNPPGLETGDEYIYARGDYYVIGTVPTSGTKYKPNGSSYIVGTASTTVETNKVKANDTYLYDGTNWIWQANTQQEVSFESLAGDPYDNTNLTTALNAKVTGNSTITGDTKCKITYDAKGLVTSGTDLTASDIPNLTLSKITDVTSSATELNILDGATVTTAELNVLDGITATTAELNILDGITASTVELNYTDGVTSNIQIQLNGKLTGNTAITGDTKCKITYDSKGLVINGDDLASTDITNALGYTPYNNSNPSGYQTNVLEGVQINSTDLTIDVNKKVNIPYGSNSAFGVIKVDNDTIQATNGVIKAKSLDGLTATVNELNVLDGITATTTELNYCDGVTSNIQTQLNNKSLVTFVDYD